MATSSPSPPRIRIRIATLGLFILDTFEWHDPTTGDITSKSTSVIGGAGTYVCVAARMWLPAQEVGIVVDRGSDWPKEVQDKLEGFGDMWCFRDDGQQLTTRALNLYQGEHRDFRYLTPRRRLSPIDLPPPLRRSTHLHFVCSPTRALEIHSQLLPPLNTTPSWSPALVYEPIPDRCLPSELPALRKVLPLLNVFSPNHQEAWAFFSVGVEEVERRGKEGVEEVAQRFFAEGAEGIVLIRSGAWGAYAVSKGEERGVWVPAYHPYGSGKVVDVTGAGNSFLGGLMAGLELYPDSLITAVQMASISASYIIEQFGLPTLTTDERGVERWNGSEPRERLREMQEAATTAAEGLRARAE